VGGGATVVVVVVGGAVTSASVVGRGGAGVVVASLLPLHAASMRAATTRDLRMIAAYTDPVAVIAGQEQ
jgi:hypothetical protein